MKWYKIFPNRREAENILPINKTLRIRLGNKNICLARTKKGFFAIKDMCPHMGIPISRGKINYLGEIVCAWHNYRYDLHTGNLCKGTGGDLKVFSLKEEKNGLFIGTDSID